jgi:Domain of unknown function (DUF4070)
MEKGRWQYWKFLLPNVFRNPSLVPISIELAVYGLHFRKVAQNYIQNSRTF